MAQDPGKDQGSGSKKPAPDANDLAANLKGLDVNGLQELLRRGLQNASSPGAAAVKDMTKHKFWQTQPVPRFDEAAASNDGPIEPEDLDKVRKEPLPLIDGFGWVTMDMNDKKEVEDVYQLLFNNYVEDDEAMFRFKYSESFLNWALKSPGWRKEWHIGIRATTSKKLVAFISAVPINLRVRTATVPCAEVNFLCVHKKLRSKRLAPVLIREITRRCNLVKIWQAIYTAGIFLPTPVSTCRYFHRSIDWAKLYEVGFSPLPAGSTRQRQILKYKLPERTATKGLRPMAIGDISQVSSLLQRYLARNELAQEFDEAELRHWLLEDGMNSPDRVVYAFVVEQAGVITDFFSFYRLESTVIGNAKHDTIRAAYLFYYATEAAFSNDKTALKKRLNELMSDALILAKEVCFFPLLSAGSSWCPTVANICSSHCAGEIRRLQRPDAARQSALPD